MNENNLVEKLRHTGRTKYKNSNKNKMQCGNKGEVYSSCLFALKQSQQVKRQDFSYEG